MNKERFEYRYEFANGDVKEFSITSLNGLSRDEMEQWIPLLKEMDREERNNNQRESRRHVSLDAYDRDDNRVESNWNGYEQVDVESSWSAILHDMTERERCIAEMFFWQGYSQREIADLFGICQQRAAQIVRRIRKKAKKKRNYFS